MYHLGQFSTVPDHLYNKLLDLVRHRSKTFSRRKNKTFPRGQRKTKKKWHRNYPPED